MIRHWPLAAFTVLAAACSGLPTNPALAPPSGCRDVVRAAMLDAYGLAHLRDEQRALISMPAGRGAADYEAETRRLRGAGERLKKQLETLGPAVGREPVKGRAALATLSAGRVAAEIAAADACIAGQAPA